jgi:ABC-2 type transport system permease protein
MKILAIVRTNLVRTLRDRTALFFSVLLPLILILVLGLTYGAGSSVRVGIADLDGGPLGRDLVQAIAGSPGVAVEIRTYGSLEDLREATSRGIVSSGVAIPAGYSDALAGGGSASVTVLTPPTQRASAVRTVIDEAIAAQVGIVRAAQFQASTSSIPFADALAAVRERSAKVADVAVTVEPVNAATATAGGYASGAQSQLVLFMFLTSLTGAIELVITRQLGVSRRMFSTPTATRTIILGESLGRIAFALVQGAFIVVASAVLFGVSWGDLSMVTAIVAMFALVAGGAAMILGSLAATPSQAGAIGPALGMMLGLLGGAMVPLEVFPETMRTAARLTPHAWAMDALAKAGANGGLTSILPQLGILAAFAAVFFGIAIVRFRLVLVGAGNRQ